jgi:radical SAM protein with 4Fe4S-binding SPASM domain
MLGNSLANYALSKINFETLKTVVAKVPLMNVPYRFMSQKLIDLRFPVHLFLEATNACNLKCDMCSMSASAQAGGTMDFDLFKKVVDESAGYGKRNFCLHIFGEPLLAPNILKMMRYIKEMNPANVILLTTNGVYLTEEKVEGILSAGVDKLTVSLIAADRDTYKEVAGHDCFDTVVANVERMLDARAGCGGARPRLTVRMLRNKRTASGEAAFKEFWSKRAVIVDVRDEHNYAGTIENVSAAPRRRHPCYHLWFSPGVSWDGDMSICCCDWDRREVLGNVKEKSVAEMWQGERIEELRRMHLAGEYDRIEICRDCDVWQSYPDIFFSWQKSRAQKAV